MLALAWGSLVVSAAMSWVIGRAVIADRDSFLRKKTGTLFLIAGGLSFVTLPPQVMSLDAGFDMLGSSAALVAPSLAWPEGFSKPLYLGLWIVSSIAALLVGMQIWNAGKPGWRPGTVSNAWDSSSAGRARALIPMANSLDDVFDALSRAQVSAKAVPAIAEELRLAGQRFAGEIPAEASAAYRLVAAKVGPATAAEVTRYLLEGAGRSGGVAAVR